MEAVMISVLGLFALGIICWEAWRERVRASKRIPAEWQAALGRIANEQELGHYRHARQGILQACRRIEHHQDSARLAKHLHVRLAGLLARDPIYTEVVRTIRSACAEEPAVSEVCCASRWVIIWSRTSASAWRSPRASARSGVVMPVRIRW